MPDDEQVDPWADAHIAQEERLAGLPPRAMLTRAEAMAKADAFLRADGSPDVAVTGTPNPLQGLWIVGHRNPQRPDDLIVGGGPLIVPTSGSAYEANGSIPPWPEEVGMEEPELWRFENGEELLPEDWRQRLEGELSQDYWLELLSFVAEERQTNDVFPPPSQTFAAFELTSYDDVRVVILGQDPYPTPGDAHGLAFSVPVGVPVPRSLQNIHKELADDLEIPTPNHGNLVGWARQGVLLLNTALTVRAGSEADHKIHRRWRRGGQGWETFTDAVIKAISAKQERVVFILWGADARAKGSLVDTSRHKVVEAVHPSPRSANRGGFFGTKPFSQANQALAAAGPGEIDWSRFEAPA